MSYQPGTRQERLFPGPVENFLAPHAACPRAVMCPSFRKRACLTFGSRTVARPSTRGQFLVELPVLWLFV